MKILFLTTFYWIIFYKNYIGFIKKQRINVIFYDTNLVTKIFVICLKIRKNVCFYNIYTEWLICWQLCCLVTKFFYNNCMIYKNCMIRIFSLWNRIFFKDTSKDDEIHWDKNPQPLFGMYTELFKERIIWIRKLI